MDEPVVAYRHLCSRLYGEDTPGRRPGGGGLRPGRASGISFLDCFAPLRGARNDGVMDSRFRGNDKKLFERIRGHTASLDREHLRGTVGRYLPTKNLSGGLLI